MITVIGIFQDGDDFAMFSGLEGIKASFLGHDEYSGADEALVEPKPGYDEEHVKKVLTEAGISFYENCWNFHS